MKKKKIAIVSRTIGLEFDDRIRKECISLSKKYDVTIFVHFYDNREDEGLTSYGIRYKSIKLNSRKIFPPSKFLLIKALEFFIKTRKYLKQYDFIWLHEEYTFLFAILMFNKKFIWDLHEIPSIFETGFLKQIFHIIEKKSIKLIHANQHRIDYLYTTGLIKSLHKNSYIRNFPDISFINNAKNNHIDENFYNWLDSSPYVYLQGLSTQKRCALESIESVLKNDNLKAIVVGEVHQESLKDLRNRYGSEVDKKIYFTGMLDQLLIPGYLRNARFSIILYNYSSQNNILCEPNRLFQAIAMQVPVIVGSNAPMKEIVEKFQNGISLETDGSSLNDILKAIDIIILEYDYYKINAKKCSKEIIWNDYDVIKHVSNIEEI
jgi:glycosyltransferase involved in cell wall biosynthesis